MKQHQLKTVNGKGGGNVGWEMGVDGSIREHKMAVSPQ